MNQPIEIDFTLPVTLDCVLPDSVIDAHDRGYDAYFCTNSDSLVNPYPSGTIQARAWLDGVKAARESAQDGEDKYES